MPAGGARQRSGPAPKPTRIKVLQGKPGHKALPVNEPEPEESDGTMPSHMSEDAQKAWPEVAKQLRKVGVLSTMDELALSMYCEAFADWIKAMEKVRRSGYTIRNSHGLGVHPNAKAYYAAHDRLLSLLREFGMTPASRTRVKVIKPPKKANAFGAIKRGGDVLQ